METSGVLEIPFFHDLLAGGVDFGSIMLVEFEPQSCWYDAAYTIAAQALRKGYKTDLHIFQSDIRAVKDRIGRFGLDVSALRDQDLFRLIDSYSVQIGVNPVEALTGTDVFKTTSIKLADWAKAAAEQISTEVPQAEHNRLHIDDNTAVLTRYNTEEAVVDYWRTRIIPLYKARASILVNAVALGVASDSFYKHHESMVDGILDCKSIEEKSGIEHYVRVRAFRGRSPNSSWQHVRLVHGEVILDTQLAKEGAQPAGERRLAAIMFTDIVGFTALTQQNEARALQLLEEHRQLVRPLLLKHNGREVSTIGDAFLVEFASSLEAVRCAVEIQTTLQDAEAAPAMAQRLRVRIGIHLGDVIHSGTDVAGDAVNIASRIQALASPGGICVTAPVRASVANQVEYKFESLGGPDLKNVVTPIEVFAVSGFGPDDG